MSEERKQRTLVRMCNNAIIKYPMLAYLHHSPNGGLRDRGTAIKMKAAGTKAGFPDLFLPFKNHEFWGFFIEMKHGYNKQTADQKKWQDYLENQGYCYEVHYNEHSAFSALIDYIENSP